MEFNPSALTFGGNPISRFCCLSGICLFLWSFFCPLSQAADVSLFGGGEFDGRGQSFSFLGLDVTQRVNSTLSLSGRLMPNYLTYKYYSGNTQIEAKSSGLFAVAGLKFNWGQTTLGLWGGGEFRNTDLSPDDKNANMRGSTSSVLVQGELDSWLDKRTNVNLFGSFSGTNNFSYEKAKIRRQISNRDYQKPYTFLVGLEEFVGTNKDYTGVGLGASVELYYIPFKASLALRGGYKHDTTFGDGGYWGLEFYKGF
jgi:hypothetical protein